MSQALLGCDQCDQSIVLTNTLYGLQCYNEHPVCRWAKPRRSADGTLSDHRTDANLHTPDQAPPLLIMSTDTQTFFYYDVLQINKKKISIQFYKKSFSWKCFQYFKCHISTSHGQISIYLSMSTTNNSAFPGCTHGKCQNWVKMSQSSKLS